MSLSFPNPSRSFDERRGGVRFWGHDGTFEVSFLVELDAIARLAAGLVRDEAGALGAFDRYRDKILRVAAKLYSHRRTNLYVLVPSDF